MCRCETGVQIRRVTRPALVVVAALAVFASGARAQSGAEPVLSWKRVGGTTIGEDLAGPATGPARNVWYSASGNRLLVETASNRIFETADFQHWQLNTTDSVPFTPAAVSSAVPPPEKGARLQAGGTRIYATGQENIFASDDSGKSWLNLTGYNNRSVIGDGFSALAVSPANAQEVAAANRFGIWRSLDGGLSWRGLNEELPNLPVRRLVARRTVALADSTLIRFESGAWVPDAMSDPQASLRAAIARRSGWQFTAAVQSGPLVYGGTADGRLSVSRDVD